MNAFTEASFVEHRGLAVLLPYLEERAYRGRIVRVQPGTQIVTPMLAWVTAGLMAPGVLEGAGSELWARLHGRLRRLKPFGWPP